MDLLRFCTIGSVDDGKSTLIGRLFYETNNIYEDQLESIREYHRRMGDKDINLAMFTDGLKAEREQGITIDVAYRYFKTEKRKFIVADCPGHVQYTRNMVTGASGCNLAILMVDAQKGHLEQTIRHAFIVSLLQIKHLIICVNKMDLMDYREEVYEKIKGEMASFLEKFDIPDVHFIPMAAVSGENILNKSEKMPWYQGPNLFYILENCYLGSDYNNVDARFPVQLVRRETLKNGEHKRFFLGKVESGTLRVGDEVVVLPSGFKSTIKSLHDCRFELNEVSSPLNCTMELSDEIDVSRGDMIARSNNLPETLQDIEAMLCWLRPESIAQNKRYLVMHTTREVTCSVQEIYYKIDINTLHKNTENKIIGMNDIGRVRLRTSSPIFVDQYKKNRNTGHFILIDPVSNETVAAGLVVGH